MKTDSSKKLAVLIDADNASADIVDALLEEIAKYGIASVKRIYGDWSSGLKKWKGALLPYAITPVQQFAYTKGKNATDMALVIDAMDLLYSNTFDGFCLVSSDSDFTRLASRIRESGLIVYGFGERKTPESFRQACDKFIYTEIFRPQSIQTAKNNAKPFENSADTSITPTIMNLIYKAVKESSDDAGWAGLGAVGSYLNKINSDFDPRNFGFSKLSDLIKSLDVFELQTEQNQLKIRKRSKLQSERTNGGGNHESTTTQRRVLEKTVVKTSEEGNTAEPTAQLADQSPVAEKTYKPSETKTNRSRRRTEKPTFSRLIPLAQQAIIAVQNESGWANVLSVAKKIKQIDPQFDPKHYGFDSAKAALHAIYGDWLAFEKQGRSEFVRIVNRFIKK